MASGAAAVGLRLWRLLVRLTLFAALLWVVAVGTLLLERRSLIYPQVQDFDPSYAGGLPRGRVEIVEASDGIPLHVWVAPPLEGRPVILHFTGNGAYTPGAALAVAPFVLRGYGAAILSYRGAGRAPGAPSEAAFTADAIAVYDALPRLLGVSAPPIIQGASLGAALAVSLASQRPAAAVVLEAPFDRLCAVAAHHYRWLPACLIQWDERWDSIDRIASVEAPLLVLAAARDTLIPPTHARRLFA
ncbi:MAG: alpha/beta hydrolase, partial [Pseudomonadota bacterium]